MKDVKLTFISKIPWLNNSNAKMELTVGKEKKIIPQFNMPPLSLRAEKESYC